MLNDHFSALALQLGGNSAAFLRVFQRMRLGRRFDSAFFHQRSESSQGRPSLHTPASRQPGELVPVTRKQMASSVIHRHVCG